jgi:mannitol/fructose-specific phosphotransferase system IIA component
MRAAHRGTACLPARAQVHFSRQKRQNITEILTLETIQLNGTANSKEDAIRMAGDLLVQAKCVHPDYVTGMLEREKTISTYAGNGVSIPHGQFNNLSQVYRTGISVLQVPAGVEWDEGEKAYLVVGIAAKGEEHIQVLANLANVLEDEDTAKLLAQTADPQVILSHLNRPLTDE